MLRRPNRASWNEGSAGRPSPLAQLLAAPRPLPPPHPAQGFVGSRHELPGMIGYGKMQQKPLEGSMFTGGRVAHPQTSLTHPQPEMPTFSQANNHAGGVAASLAALGLLAGTPHGGMATPTLPPGPGTQMTSSTGATPAPPEQPTLTTGVRQVAGPSPLGHPEVPVHGVGGQSPLGHTEPPIRETGAPSPLLHTLLAALGQKPNPSAGTRGIYLS